MTLQKAIETLTFEDKATLHPRNSDFWSAIRLLIEAGKRVQELRDFNLVTPGRILPGETET